MAKISCIQIQGAFRGWIRNAFTQLSRLSEEKVERLVEDVFDRTERLTYERRCIPHLERLFLVVIEKERSK